MINSNNQTEIEKEIVEFGDDKQNWQPHHENESSAFVDRNKERAKNRLNYDTILDHIGQLGRYEISHSKKQIINDYLIIITFILFVLLPFI